MTDKSKKRRPYFQWAAFFGVLAAVIYGGYQAMTHPNTSLPPEWNPTVALSVDHKRSPLTMWKLKNALANADQCHVALENAAVLMRLPDFEKSESCHIRDQVELKKIGQSFVKPFNTRCQMALRMAMWEKHGIQPAALKHLQTPVHEIKHYSSYSCRKIRTVGGDNTRMSTHATAEAIDVSGFVLKDGQKIYLKSAWNGPPNQAAFLRDVRDSACDWFKLILSPDFNSLHADHFHLQHKGWNACR